jgi:iron complex transport system permease protein
VSPTAKILLLALAAPLAIALGVAAGALPADPALATQILWELRVPRVAAAFACGGLLALAGALMQTLFRNPLAEPYLLGVSGGAGLAALLGMAMGLAWPWYRCSRSAAAWLRSRSPPHSADACSRATTPRYCSPA